jgi:uncharacterized protein YehS (DUF1456 family)
MLNLALIRLIPGCPILNLMSLQTRKSRLQRAVKTPGSFIVSLKFNFITMTNNDIMRRIRYIFDFSDSKMIEIFAIAGHQVTRSQISGWLKKEEDPTFCDLDDHQLAIFLNGLINEKRGKKEGEQPIPEKRLNNNIIFRKLKIALNLKDDDILEILELADIRISRHELSAFFRNPNQRQYRPCNDQILRNFLLGLQTKYAR